MKRWVDVDGVRVKGDDKGMLGERKRLIGGKKKPTDCCVQIKSCIVVTLTIWWKHLPPSVPW